MLRLSLFAAFATVVLAGCNRPAPVTPPKNSERGANAEKDGKTAINDSKNSERDGNSTLEEKKKPEKAEAGAPNEYKSDFKVTAIEITAEFLKDPKVADKKYTGKIVEMTGHVHQVTDRGEFQCVGVKDEKSGLDSLVICKVKYQDKNQVAIAGRLSKGQKVKVVAEFLQSPEPTAVEFARGILIELEPSKLAAAISAEDFFKAFAANKEKYDSRDILVKGKFIEVGRNKSGSMVARLAAGDKKFVAFRVLPAVADEIQQFVGREVEMRGYLGSRHEENEIDMQTGILIHSK